jgi:hypothetical protein
MSTPQACEPRPQTPCPPPRTHLTRAAACEHRGEGQEARDLAARVERVDAEAVARAAGVGDDQVDRLVVLEEGDAARRPRRREQRALDLGARRVGGVHDAAPAVAALAREVEAAGRVAAEGGAEARKLEHARGALAADDADSPGGGERRG